MKIESKSYSSKFKCCFASSWSLLIAVCGESILARARASMVPPTFRRPSRAELILPSKLYPPRGNTLGCPGVSFLGQKQRKVISRRFGFYGFDGDTLDNVGKEIGLTRERVRQIQLEALNCLRVILAREGVASELLSDLG